MIDKPNICFRCGKQIQAGGIFYDIELNITSGFNGVITETADPDKIRKLLEEMESSSAIFPEEDVHKKMKIVLCKSCKDVLVRTLVGPETTQNNGINKQGN